MPFCFHKCHYCDFYSVVDRRGREPAFIERMLEEVDSVSDYLPRPLETIFVGGGTPTLLAAESWVRLGAALAGLPRVQDLEWSVEANPETVDEERAAVLAEVGVNRASVGCQSFDPRHLETLERWHEPESVERAVEILRRHGIDRINLDLIFGIPGQTVDEWSADLDRALALEPGHLSCYGLTYEPNTPMTVRMRAGDIEPIDEDVEAAMYELTMARLAAAGFEHYEVSNWARPGQRCRHNLLYWTNADWWPVGPAAAGHLDGLRWRNAPRLDSYLDDRPLPSVVDVEPRDPARRVGEILMLGLRLREGLPEADVARVIDEDAPAATRRREAIARHETGGRLERREGRLRLTRAGLLVADGVISELI